MQNSQGKRIVSRETIRFLNPSGQSMKKAGFGSF